MATIISVLIILICIFLILVVLIQNPKGGGLSSAFSSSNQLMGVQRTGDFLEKTTWTLAGALIVLSLATSIFDKPTADAAVQESAIQEQIDNQPLQSVPQMPNNAPTPEQK